MLKRENEKKHVKGKKREQRKCGKCENGKEKKNKKKDLPKRRRRKKGKHPAAPKHLPRTRTKPHRQGGSRHSCCIVKTFLCADEYLSSETQNCDTHRRPGMATCIACRSLIPQSLGLGTYGSRVPGTEGPRILKIEGRGGDRGSGQKNTQKLKKRDAGSVD